MMMIKGIKKNINKSLKETQEQQQKKRNTGTPALRTYKMHKQHPLAPIQRKTLHTPMATALSDLPSHYRDLVQSLCPGCPLR